MNIYITGCARSGTTLLQQMMRAFEEVEILPGERPMDVFSLPEIREKAGETHLVAKRTSVYFAGLYPEGVDPRESEQIEQFREILFRFVRQHNLRIIDIYRDPRDVLTSRHHSKPDEYYVSLHRLIAQHEEITWLRERWDKVSEVCYEDLLRKPDDVQDELGDSLDLSARTDFSNYPDFLSGDEALPVDQANALQGVRPLDPEHIGRWRQRDPEYIKTLAREQPVFNKLLVKLGYENEFDWFE